MEARREDYRDWYVGLSEERRNKLRIKIRHDARRHRDMKRRGGGQRQNHLPMITIKMSGLLLDRLKGLPASAAPTNRKKKSE
jgi:hypothetical protein